MRPASYDENSAIRLVHALQKKQDEDEVGEVVDLPTHFVSILTQ